LEENCDVSYVVGRNLGGVKGSLFCGRNLLISSEDMKLSCNLMGGKLYEDDKFHGKIAIEFLSLIYRWIYSNLVEYFKYLEKLFKGSFVNYGAL